MPETSSFGERLRALRAERGLSAEAVARRLVGYGIDITAAAITGWERGEFGGKRKTQQRREVVEALDEVLEADGELVKAFGFDVSGPTLSTRISALEQQVTELRRDLSRLLEHPRRPGRAERP